MGNSKISLIKEKEFYDEVVNTWGTKYKGKGIIKSNDKLKYQDIISSVISKMITKKENLSVLIIVRNYDERMMIINKLTEDDIYNKIDLKVISIDYFVSSYYKNYDLAVVVGVHNWINFNSAFIRGNFKLGFILDKVSPSVYKEIDEHIPIIDYSSLNNDLANLRLQHPVEEEWIEVNFTPQDLEKYNKYTDFITGTISIFGSFANIDKARRGTDTESSEQILHNVAKYNGWSENLDTNLSFNRDIDNYFNPIVLKERVNNCYNIIRERQLLLTDNDSKLDIISNLVEQNKDKSILIISKRGEYASKVTETINFKLGNICGDFHDKIEPRHLVDSKGKLVLVKKKDSPNYGQPRIVKSQYISNANMRLFQLGKLNVLSIKNNSSESLKIDVGVIIFTSPLCDLIDEFRYKFSDINYNTNPLKVYKVFLKDTIEEKALLREKESSYHKIISNVKFSNSCENFPEIICE